jgi:dTDP-4-dehydrorhamnose reductase
MNVLVTGANGQLGNELKKLSLKESVINFCFTDIEELDITDPAALKKFLNNNPQDHIINCAAYTAVDRAEEEEDKAYQLNLKAVQLLAQECLERKIQLIHFSTDFVFDGSFNRPYRESDKPNPLSVYGKSKYAGEQYMHGLKTGITIRTSWLYSASGNNFVKTMIRLGKERDVVKVVYDQTGTPTFAGDLAQMTIHMLKKLEKHDEPPLHKLFHYSNEGVCSWYDIAVHVIRYTGLDCRIEPIETKDYPTPALRPTYSVMNKSKIKDWLGIDIPYWTDSLKKCCAELTK